MAPGNLPTCSGGDLSDVPQPQPGTQSWNSTSSGSDIGSCKSIDIFTFPLQYLSLPVAGNMHRPTLSKPPNYPHNLSAFPEFPGVSRSKPGLTIDRQRNSINQLSPISRLRQSTTPDMPGSPSSPKNSVYSLETVPEGPEIRTHDTKLHESTNIPAFRGPDQDLFVPTIDKGLLVPNHLDNLQGYVLTQSLDELHGASYSSEKLPILNARPPSAPLHQTQILHAPRLDFPSSNSTSESKTGSFNTAPMLHMVGPETYASGSSISFPQHANSLSSPYINAQKPLLYEEQTHSEFFTVAMHAAVDKAATLYDSIMWDRELNLPEASANSRLAELPEALAYRYALVVDAKNALMLRQSAILTDVGLCLKSLIPKINLYAMDNVKLISIYQDLEDIRRLCNSHQIKLHFGDLEWHRSVNDSGGLAFVDDRRYQNFCWKASTIAIDKFSDVRAAGLQFVNDPAALIENRLPMIRNMPVGDLYVM